METKREPAPKTIKDIKKDFKETLSTMPIDKNETTMPTNKNIQSGGPKTPASSNNVTGKYWMKIFSMSQPKPTPSSTNDSTSNGTSNHQPELDICYITPRVIVMTTPRDNSSDVSSRSTAESIRDILDTKHPNCYMLYLLDQSSNNESSYPKEIFHNRVLEIPLFDDKQSPSLVSLLWFCQKITSYLLESSSNVVVLDCNDGKNQLAYGVCSLLAYHKILPQADQIIKYYQHHRSLNSSLTMSQKRYIQYLCDLSHGIIEHPHFNKLTLKSINLSPVPLVNIKKNSCRPFIDIYDQEHKKIFSTYQEIPKLRVYYASDTCITIPVDLQFDGDITIHITHAALCAPRHTHEGGVRICELTVNSNFSTLNHPELSYSRNELDEIDHNEKNPTVFRITLDIINQQQSSINRQDSFTKELDKTFKQPLALFRDEVELKQKTNDFSEIIEKKEVPVSPAPVVVHRLSKGKEDSMSSQGSRFSDSFPGLPQSPQPPFSNPLYNPFKQHANTSPRSSQIPSSPISLPIDDKLKKEENTTAPLFEFNGDSRENGEIFVISPSTDPPQRGFYSSTDSGRNLLDDDLHTDNPTLQNTLSQPTLRPPLSATKAPETQKPSPATEQPITTSAKPNYTVTMETDIPPPSQPKPKTPKSKPPPTARKPTANFASLLPDDFCLRTDGPPRTFKSEASGGIGDLQKAAVAKDIDPTVLKVREWTEGKKRNIRALLCSLSDITWPECGWRGCQMSELLTPDQVKKVYRRAVLYIHPDKLRGDPNEPLAKLIFVELNEAWSQFEQQGV
ncbi:unnamed protein product [Adineta steineri]|uniref:Uncharacterized protein n=1 Tax=Adineta steineri TaxID=433720 RepID=A0A813XSF3_9BILA|nr:unnamed protein product [Adineta steineri]CAF3939950.1 unnamed protein product [Adineta steineri]